ncbi:cytochrome c oxidase accessory protein CcoG [Ignatzschineria cameli]|uniref:Cytochrome c oxidase accessory protein CcoG n=1 Tax=Ignatzschineria cameli TaxID=2182793 RepID=A0A2U2AT73_9GAMM|nr:cytochrome c oxidase accessory protein CcoG [Ignatzschineria cameli]PWD87825.1 cytochrome c oxidase accessory protein CcoG [Ignatzschineria cameli]PWD90394.1 cytochrome c oxidase accessory protein CcoG [Ignatzschineria cameli]PWD92277.1 cytochrome c oxidase accessory protein CcoG [Ignatzschineria cameli]PWD93071.1 cytochrome c oxidase accessory protein CcoG [Ignatzschineria cameli]
MKRVANNLSEQNNTTPSGDSLYAKRIPIYPRSVKGKFRTFKSSVLALAFLVFYLLPWVPWDRGPGLPGQAVVFDLTAKTFYIFSLPVDIQNIFWLAGVLAIFAFSLFFVTAVLGRVFCGYFCFQTLWTDAFIMIESVIQGNRNARKRLHEGPWTGEKFSKIGLTWLVWLIFAAWTGFTFTSYWMPAPELIKVVFIGKAPFAAYGTIAFITAATFIMAGFSREQVCTYMCPYARFQGVMFDKDTLVVTYDEARGERTKGRAKPTKALRDRDTRIEEGYGDCIDCDLCVQVCPAGIDIRDGINYRCITCGLCIDACHNMMTSLKYPTGLIRYASENSLEGKKTNYFTPRNIGYGIVIIIVAAILAWSVSHRDVAHYIVESTRKPPTLLSDGRLQNTYELKFNNLTLESQKIHVAVEDPGYELAMRFNDIILKPGERVALNAAVRKDKGVAFIPKVTFDITVSDPETGDVIDKQKMKAIFLER